MTIGEAFVAAAIGYLLCVIILLCAAVWLRIHQRRIERDLESFKSGASIGREDTIWLLREALRMAEHVPRFAARKTNPGSGRREP